MNKKIFMLFAVLFLIGVAGVVYGGISKKQDGGYNIEVHLSKGWNLISILLPQYGVIDYDSDIKIEDIKAIFYYSSIKNKYIEFYPRFSESELSDRENNDNLLMNSAWVYSNREGYLRYSTPPGYPEQPEGGFYQELFKGWNFISLTPEMIGKTLNDIKGNCNIEKAYFWSPKHETKWLPWNDEILRYGENSGLGFVIKVSDDCTLSSSNSGIGDIPQLPN